MFAAPFSTPADAVNLLDLIPAEQHAEAKQFFRELTLMADVRGITIAEALADVLRPHLSVLRRGLGVEAFEERAMTITDMRGNELSFVLTEPDTRHLQSA